MKKLLESNVDVGDLLAYWANAYPNAPVHILEAIDEYAENGTPAGGFVTAVLENDLAGAFARADLGSRAGLADILRFVQNEIPHPAHGSSEAVEYWTQCGWKVSNNG